MDLIGIGAQPDQAIQTIQLNETNRQLWVVLCILFNEVIVGSNQVRTPI